MLPQLQQLLTGGQSMEDRFFDLMRLLDLAETKAVGMLEDEMITPDIVAKISALKDEVIKDFGRENAETVAVVLAKVEAAKAAMAAEAAQTGDSQGGDPEPA